MAPLSTVRVAQSFSLPRLIRSPLSLLLAVPKRDDDDDKTLAPPEFQENVFIEASRPKYVENLHNEALEGLKMMQQEGTKHTSDAFVCLCTKLEVSHAKMLITVCILLQRVCTR